MQPTNASSLKDFDLVENHVTLSKITMSDLSSPTRQKNLCKTYNTFFGGVRVRDVPPSRTLHSRLPPLFLDFLTPISPVSTPFGRRGGDQGCPNLRYFAFPVSGLFFLTSSVPLALFRLPLGGEGGFRNVPTSRTLHSRLPASFSWLPQSH